MAEDHEELLVQGPAQQSAQAPPRSSRVSRGQQRRRQRSVFQYITILFAAALVLLFYTYMMERRQFEQRQEENQANLSDLQQESVSAVQRLQGLVEENDLLKRQVLALQEDQAALEENISQLETQAARLQAQLERTSQAMGWFWQIDEAYARGRNNLCRDLIASFEAAGLADALPTENTTGTDRFSPADRYQEIYDSVM